jgi:streptomycin 6-kinase
VHALIPASFSALVTGREHEPHISGDAWLVRLPEMVAESLAQWSLTLDDDPMHGMAALVLPVRRHDGSSAVLKMTWPHGDAQHEHPALQHWAGRGTLQPLAANPAHWTSPSSRRCSRAEPGTRGGKVDLPAGIQPMGP